MVFKANRLIGPVSPSLLLIIFGFYSWDNGYSAEEVHLYFYMKLSTT
jgi:uncharacterized protein YqgC (DUF456 family)